jgi:glutathione S-transferase
MTFHPSCKIKLGLRTHGKRGGLTSISRFEHAQRTWAPSRLLLNLKNIPYRTEWISYPDIEGTFKTIGIEPTTKRTDGRDLYTCPAIIDPTSPQPTRIADSTYIAEYLDSAYSEARDGPSVFRGNSKTAQLAFIKDILTPVAKAMRDLVLPLVPNVLEDRGSEYYLATKRGNGGETLDRLCTSRSESRAEAIRLLEGNLDLVAQCYDTHPDGENYLYLGEGVAYVDIWLMGNFLWARFIPSDRDGDAGSVWDIIKVLNGGRWMRLMETFESHLQIR